MCVYITTYLVFDMKVLPFKIPRSQGEPIMLQHDREPHIYNTLHQHPELQLMLIKESSGTAVIGGYIGEFHPGDVFVIGSNVPHVFRNDEAYYQGDAGLRAEVVYVFLDDSLPKSFILNFAEVEEMFTMARQGIRLKGGLREEVAGNIEGLLGVSGLDKLIAVLTILSKIIKSESREFLNKEIVHQRIDENDGARLNNVIQYTFEHYGEKITLDQVSEVANMVPSAFCRFFKQRTRKTYFDFLNEIRIRKACNLLLDKDLTIVEICFQSGFNNLSYFNRKFKEMTGYSPLKYHKAIKGK